LSSAQFRIWTQTLKRLQQDVAHPTISEFTDSARAAQTSLQDCRPLAQTRTDWLPALQAESVGTSDWAGCEVSWAYAP
jgi:hypothetical protein